MTMRALHRIMLALLSLGAVALLWAAWSDATHQADNSRRYVHGEVTRLHVPAGESVRLHFRRQGRVHNWECCTPGGWDGVPCRVLPRTHHRVRFGDERVVADATDIIVPAGVLENWNVGENTHMAVLAQEDLDCRSVELVKVTEGQR